jgi:hypothetical protein
MPSRPPRSPAPSRSGILTILALFLLGGLFVGGLYLTAYTGLPPGYRRSTPGVPARSLRIVSWDVKWGTGTDNSILERFRADPPDLLLLQRVTRKTAQEVAQSLEMKNGGELQMYYSPTNLGDPSEPGNAVLSRHPLFKGRSIPKPKYVIDPNHPPPQGFGVWAEVVVEGRRFLAGSVQWTDGAADAEARSLLGVWQRQPGMPLLVGAIIDPAGDRSESSPIHRIERENPFRPASGIYASSEWEVSSVASDPSARLVSLIVSAGTSPASAPSTIPSAPLR